MKNKPHIPYYFNKYNQKIMTGEEKLVEATNTVADIKAKIQEKYDRVMVKIKKIQDKIAELDRAIKNAVANTIKWINDQKKKLMEKLEKLRRDLEKWLQDQLRKVQQWLDNVKKEIQEFIGRLILSMILALQ